MSRYVFEQEEIKRVLAAHLMSAKGIKVDEEDSYFIVMKASEEIVDVDEVELTFTFDR
jgi:5S rRNA maturation endonuclease (ribonuclease M5)